MTIWDKLTKVVLVLLLVAVALLVVFSYLPLIHQNERMRQEILKLEEVLRKEQAANRELMLAIEALRSDPSTVERLAREKMGLAKPGETVIRFEEPPASTNSVAIKP